MAVLVKHTCGDGDFSKIGAQIVHFIRYQTTRCGYSTQRRFDLGKTQGIIVKGMVAVKGNGKGGVIADAEADRLCIGVFHS